MENITTTQSCPDFQVPNLERGLQIFEYLSGRDEDVTISQISRDLGFPLNSVMRIMNALAHHEYVQRSPDTKGYILTNKMLTIAAGRASQKNLMELSLDVMRKIRDEMGETVVVSVLDRGEGLILAQVQGLHPFRFVCEPGTRQAIHASASTKAIVAFKAADEQADLVRQIDFVRLTENTITSATAFKRELAAVAEKGYALDRAESLNGVHCVAAPIFDADGRPIAAITVTGPSYRITHSEFESIGCRMRDHTTTVSRLLGCRLHGSAGRYR